jgi:CRISPR-associated endoribonuclease Cas6
VSRYELSTAALHARRGPALKIGYVGTVRYEVRPGTAPLTARVLHTLAKYAFYAGIGYGTPRGMGQAREMPE